MGEPTIEPTICPRCGRTIVDAQAISRCPHCGYLLTGPENSANSADYDPLDSATRPAAPAAQFAAPKFSDAAHEPDSQTRALPYQPLPGAAGNEGASGGNPTPQAIWPVASASAADALDAGTRPLPDQPDQPNQAEPVTPLKAGIPAAGAPQTGVSPQSADPLLAPTADLPAQPKEPTQTLPPQAIPAPPPSSSPDAQGNGGAKRAPWRAISIAALLVALLIVGGLGALASQGKLLPTGARPTAITQKPTATSGAPANFTTYTNKGHYSIAYPSSWGIGQSNQTTLSLVILSYRPSAANMNIEYFKADATQDLARQDDTFLQAFEKKGTALQNKTGPMPVTIGGQQWTQEAADVTLTTSSLLAHVVAVSTMRGSYAYTIAYLAPATNALGPGAQFTQVDAAYFQPMLKTFTFLG